ncbi:hypothetical protein EXIGLDRAFT_390655 [Exidia glandulosa HHB12029]|uniref:Uncharacterized protein n=1 Tax=Exidia glandulosa HHB12029 TaxID=1314781 RepID=A0A165KZI1_EXIGL|nr:hypothetical protein EXIGLDRAFT_390655 [Exidia glandulosa HHB12029]
MSPSRASRALQLSRPRKLRTGEGLHPATRRRRMQTTRALPASALYPAFTTRLQLTITHLALYARSRPAHA